MTFVFKCKACGTRIESSNRNYALESYCKCGAPLQRDYSTEGVGLGTGVKVSRDGTLRDQAKLFLPGNDEFKGPGDPDGKKGARQWLESHRPKHPGGRNPLLEIERKVY